MSKTGDCIQDRQLALSRIKLNFARKILKNLAFAEI
jgi:hypothetical protein